VLKRYSLIFVLTAVCGTPLVDAQSSTVGMQEPQNSGTVLKSETHSVVVDVVVTRGKDEPVVGLKKQDFQLIEDGKAQSIDFFEEHTAPVVAAALAPIAKMPPHVYTNVPAAPQIDAVNVLLLDSLNTPRQDQSTVHQQILEFLKTMKPNGRIAIFTLGTRLRLIQGFTDDPALLQAAINDKSFGLKPTTTNVSRTRQDDDEDKKEIANKSAAFGGSSRGGGGRGASTAGVVALQEAQAEYAEFQGDQRTVMTLDALKTLGRYLAGIPGRKNLIWFASSYPIYFFPKASEKQPFNDGHREFTNEIKETAGLLTLSKVAVYPIDAEGMMNDHPLEAEHDFQAAGIGGGLLSNVHAGSDQRSAKMSAMEQIAADTGGEAIFNTNGLSLALDHVLRNGAHYYTIVYTPTNKEKNGQFRSIHIKLEQEKCKLSYRRGYYADEVTGPKADFGAAVAGKGNSGATPEKIAANLAERNPLETLLARGMPSASQILFGVRVLPASPQPEAGAKRAGMNAKLAGPVTRYAADFLIDGKMVQLAPGSDGKRIGNLRVEIVAYDQEGKVLNWVGGRMNMEIDAATYATMVKSGIPAHFEMDVPAGKAVFLATGVYDFGTNKAGSLEVQLEPAVTQTAVKGSAGSH